MPTKTATTYGDGALSPTDDMIEFVIVGGFLGAGKTTALLRMARHYTRAGKRVGVITNDQADGLVDTETFRTQGFVTEEIPSGCFCCKFDELVAAAGRLADGHRPDVLLAEPVGSCTDLVATVINPLKKLYADRFSVAPYVALLDPARAKQALGGGGGFSAKVTYLFKMQQNEASVVAINKIDLLSTDEREELMELVRRNFPKAQVLAVSARTGEGFDELMRAIDGTELSPHPALDIDYDKYAEAEALLGWVDLVGELAANEKFSIDSYLIDLAEQIGKSLASAGLEVAHVKIMLATEGVLGVVNLTGNDRSPELSRQSNADCLSGTVTVNARVEGDPDILASCVSHSLNATAKRLGINCEIKDIRAMSPGRPVPTHRLNVVAD